jgi:hypothetical protein
MDKKEYNQLNKDKVNAWNKDSIKRYHDKNKERLKEYRKQYSKKRRQNDPLYKLNRNVRSMISRSIKEKNFSKDTRSEEILGCSWIEFKQHLESQFEPWMTWDNYGTNSPSGMNVTWDLDHIIPLNTAICSSDVVRLNHYTNLRPLCSYYNRFIKAGKV